ncbi:MAG: alpha/beta hydrolase [Anaerolineales bacterium]|nr:alpha/beta hydrolase [Anaerolineales bacterium]
MTFLTLDKTPQIYYELIDGDANKPRLVFLHEGLGCAAMWKDFPRRLCEATGLRGLVYDRIGYGKSSALVSARTIHYMHEYALTELPQVIAQVIPDSDYFLVGHSDGGSIALIHAAEKPARLRGIITEAAHVFVEQETIAGIQVAAESYQAGKLRGLSKYHGEKTDVIFKAWSETWLTDWFGHWNIEYLLPSIECPVLAMQGMDDQYGTVAQVEAIASKALNAQKALIENCGHSPHQERADVVLQLMKDFLASDHRR